MIIGEHNWPADKCEYVLVDPSREFLFFLILKNAHTSFRKQLLDNNWQYLERKCIIEPNNSIFKNAKKIIILRDPLERWLSAFNTLYLGEKEGISNFLPKSFLKLYESEYYKEALHMLFKFGDLELDFHTRLQYKQLMDSVYSKTLDNSFVFFWLKPDVNLSIQHFLYENGVMVDLNDHKINPTDKTLPEYQKILDFVNNNQYARERLKEYLEPDYDLLKKAFHER